MTQQEIQKIKIISLLWGIVKLANNEEICMADLSEGVPDGDTPDGVAEYIVEDFKSWFSLYGSLAIAALKDGLYLADKEVYQAEDITDRFQD